MSQPTPDLPDPVVVHETVVEAAREQAKQWRRLWIGTFLAYFVIITFIAIGTLEWHENNQKRDQQIADLEQIAQDIDGATGPEAQAQQRLIIQELVDAIDCSQRAAFQEALDALVDEGILSRPIIVRPTDCKRQP